MRLRHRAPAAGNVAQGQEEENQPAADQQDALQHVGPDHRGQTAAHGVDADEHHRRDQHDPEIGAGDVGEGEGAGIKDRRQEDEHIGEQHREGVDVTADRAESAAEELRHGRDLGAQVDGNEEQQQQRDRRPREPLPVRHAHAHDVGHGHGADNLLARNAGGHPGGADRVPGKGVGREEVVASGLFEPRPARQPTAITATSERSTIAASIGFIRSGSVARGRAEVRRMRPRRPRVPWSKADRAFRQRPAIADQVGSSDEGGFVR